MKSVLIIVAVFVVLFVVRRILVGSSISPAEAASRVAAGRAILVDVREPGEWVGGVAAPAMLCPMSDLRRARARWRPVLEAGRDKELILYCASGARSGVASAMLRKEGFDAVNAGGFDAWRSAGLPVRSAD